jgi:hypothetical protein
MKEIVRHRMHVIRAQGLSGKRRYRREKLQIGDPKSSRNSVFAYQNCQYLLVLLVLSWRFQWTIESFSPVSTDKILF